MANLEGLEGCGWLVNNDEFQLFPQRTLKVGSGVMCSAVSVEPVQSPLEVQSLFEIPYPNSVN